MNASNLPWCTFKLEHLYSLTCLYLMILYVLKFSDVTEQLVQQCYQTNENADQLISNADELLSLNRALMRYIMNKP